MLNQEEFLEFLETFPNLAQACKVLKIPRSTLNNLRARDPKFDKATKAAISNGVDAIEAEAIRRGVEGVKKDVYYKGEKIGDETVYSDTLLKFILTHLNPKKFNPGCILNIEDKNKNAIVTFKLEKE